MKFDFSQVKKFIIGGGSSTALHYGVMGILIYLVKSDPVYATAIGAFCGAVLNYLIQYHYTFESKQPHLYALSVYAVTVLFGFFGNILLFALLYKTFGINVIVSQLLTTLSITILNFILYKYFIFNSKESR